MKNGRDDWFLKWNVELLFAFWFQEASEVRSEGGSLLVRGTL